MGIIDEWWEELDSNSDLEEFIANVAYETSETLDLPPGLALFLERNSLGIVPLSKSAVSTEEVEEPYMTEVDHGVFDRSHDPLADLAVVPPFKVGDKVDYRTAPDSRGGTKAGRGFIKRMYDHSMYVIEIGQPPFTVSIQLPRDTMKIVQQ